MKALVTGSAGFFGGVLRDYLLRREWEVAGVDILEDAPQPGYSPRVVDIRDLRSLTATVGSVQPDVIFHCAAVLAHDSKNRSNLWTSNVDGTANVAQAAIQSGVRRVVFLSSNCLWGSSLGRAITETDPPSPVEVYGHSKLAGEQELQKFQDRLQVKIIRCPTIVEAGRLGLLAILFEFIHENRRVWVVGGGRNHYQFISAEDLANACLMLGLSDTSGVFHVGSENVPSVREMYEEIIRRAGSRSRVTSLPRRPAVLALQLLSAAGLSPLGPYHYRMIASDFEFDTTRLRETTGWRPTVGNTDMLWRAYEFYADHLHDFDEADVRSAHRRPSGMGALKLVKWLS